jgi:hypothetical protein
MNTHPVVLLEPMFRWLDGIIRGYGLSIYMALVWLSPLLIAWILSGGFWRRPPRQRRTAKAPPILRQSTSKPPPLPPIATRSNNFASDDDSQAFAA